MLPRAEAPARRLPYTTADMSERLAKRKAEQDAGFKAFPGGVTKPVVESEGSSPGWLSQLGSMAKNVALTAGGTLGDMVPYVANIPGVKGSGAWGYEPEDAGTSNFFQAGGQALEQSGRRLVGDVTAIPGLGKDSPSYTADQIRKYGVAEGLASATLDYGNLALTAAPFVKPTNMVIGNAINDAKYAAYLRRTKSPFPDVAPPKPGTFIDVDALQGSRPPARVVDSPTPPATRLAEAQTQRAPYVPQQTGYRTEHTKWWDATKHQAHEVDELGNSFPSLENYPNHEGIWVTHKFDDALKYGDDIREVNLTNATPIHYDGDGGYFYVRPRNAPIATPSERFGQALAQRMNAAELAQGGTRDAGTIRLPGGEPTPEIPAAQLQRETARAELGINIQDIEFPPKSNPLTRPQIIDDSGYGVFPNGAWKVLGLEQYNAGINSANLPNEMNALREYFGHDYDGFQETLRNPNPVPNNVFTEKIKIIDKIFEITTPTTEQFKVFRGVRTGGNYLSGDYLGAFYRSLQPGHLIIEPGYLSTSINKDIAQEWANDFADDYLLIINVPEGSVAVNPITSWEQGLKEFDEHLNAPTEEELLFNRGTVLRIIDNDMGVIHAEIVPNYTDKKQPLSLSQPKEALLKQYSYRDLAEMIADEDTQRDFYVAYFNQQPDIDSLISKQNGAGMRAYDLADTIVELRYNVGFDPNDYWKFREIVDQITQTPANKRASESLRNSTSQKLISLFKKHQLLESDTIEFLQENLQEILKPPPYNRLLDE